MLPAPLERPAVAGTRSPGALLSEVAPRRSVIHHWNRLRVVAMLDIACFHLTHRYLFAGIGLPVFLLLSMSLGPSAQRPPEWRAVLRRRVARLAGPWLFWNVALGVLMVLRALRHHEAPLGWAHPSMLLGGVQPHLWFLPFATLAGMLVVALDRLARRWPAGRVAAATLPFAAFADVAHMHLPYVEPFSQWAFALPCVPLGLGLSALLRDAGAHPERVGLDRALPLGLYVGVYGALSLTLAEVGLDGEHDAPRFAMALAALYVLWLLPDRPDRWSALLEPLLLGVFVLHITVGYLAFDRLVPSGTLSPALETTAIVACTALIVAALRQVPLLRLVL